MVSRTHLLSLMFMKIAFNIAVPGPFDSKVDKMLTMMLVQLISGNIDSILSIIQMTWLVDYSVMLAYLAYYVEGYIGVSSEHGAITCTNMY